MAYLLRSLAVIGVIALNSPVQGEKSAGGGAAPALHALTKSAAQVDAHGAMQSLAAAREAAQIIASLDPETRQRMLAFAVPAMAGRPETRETAKPR